MKDFIVASAMEKAEEFDAAIERWELDAEDGRVVMDVLLHASIVVGPDVFSASRR